MSSKVWNKGYFWVTFTVFVVLIVFNILLAIAQATLSPSTAFSVYSAMLSTFVSLLSSSIALSIPFIMKNIDIKNKRREERDKEMALIRITLERIKQYFRYLVKESPDDIIPAGTMPFFRYMAKLKAEILLKLAIEVDIFIDIDNHKYTRLYILDQYQFEAGRDPKLKCGKTMKDISLTKENLQTILLKMITFANTIFELGIDSKLASLEFDKKIAKVINQEPCP